MNTTEITTQYTETSIKASKLQNLYLETLQILGKEHEATQSLWNAYLAADEIAQPWRVKMGQLSMQEQIDNGATEATFEVVSVELDRVEGDVDECGLSIVNSLHSANLVLKDWAWGMEEDRGGYDKVDFTVHFSDGSSYSGRFDLMASHRHTADLKAQMVSHLKWVAANGDYVGTEYAANAAASLPSYEAL